MNIKEASAFSHLPPKTIRYYEEIGLITPARAANGYRHYEENDIHALRFVGRARSLGFSVEECRTLLALYNDETRASADVKSLALRKIAEIERKMDELHSMKLTLSQLADHCAGDKRPNCPILADMARADE